MINKEPHWSEIFRPDKHYYTEEEIALAYSIWNEHLAAEHGPRNDTRCSSCRRSVIIGVCKLAKKLK